MSDALEVAATGAAADAVSRTVPTLVAERFASRLFAKDATLWGPEAEDESGKRLGWVGLHRPPARSSVRSPPCAASSRTRITHVALCGMGGSSLAPEVICATHGVELTVATSDPDQVRAALADRIASTVVVVSSKSGSTVETDSQRRAFEQAFRDAGST